LDDARLEAIDFLKKAKQEKKLQLPPVEWFVKLYTDVRIDTITKTAEMVSDVDLGFDLLAEQISGMGVGKAAEKKEEKKHEPSEEKKEQKPKPATEDPFELVLSQQMRSVEESVGIQHSAPPSTEKVEVNKKSATVSVTPTVPVREAFNLPANEVLRRIKQLRMYNNLLRRKRLAESRYENYKARRNRGGAGVNEEEDEKGQQLEEEKTEASIAIADARAQWDEEEELMFQQLARKALKELHAEDDNWDDEIYIDVDELEEDELEYLDRYFGSQIGGYARSAYESEKY